MLREAMVAKKQSDTQIIKQRSVKLSPSREFKPDPAPAITPVHTGFAAPLPVVGFPPNPEAPLPDKPAEGDTTAFIRRESTRYDGDTASKKAIKRPANK